MKVATGKVVEGKIVVEGDPFEEGITVTVMALESDEVVHLSPQEEAALLTAIEEADAGDFVSGEQVLRELRGQH
jgi:hypothetical protein